MNLSSIPIFILLPITMASSLTFGIVRNYFCKDFSSSNRGRFLFNAVLSFICAIFIFCFSGFQIKASTYTLLLAIAFGVVTTLSTVLYLVAVSKGPWSYTIIGKKV